MNETDAKAAAAAARHILGGTGEAPEDERTRAVLEDFYALVHLLPPAEADPGAVEPHPDARAKGAVPVRAKGAVPVRAEEAGHGTRRTRPHTVAVPVAALVALAAALVFVTALLFLPRGSFAPQTAVYLSGTGAARSARGVVLAGADDTFVFASGLSELTPGYRYVAWQVDEDGYERIGSMVTLGGGRARLRVGTDVDSEQIEITIEPSASTGEPEGPTVLAGFRDFE